MIMRTGPYAIPLIAAVMLLMGVSAEAGPGSGMELGSTDLFDTWHYEYVDLDFTTTSADMQLNWTGYPVLCYKASGSSPWEGLRYAEFNGSEWIETSIDPGWTNGNMNCLLLSSEWYPSIVYRESDLDDFRYAWYDGSDWNIETFWMAAGNGLDAVMDPEDVLHTCFSNTFSDNHIFYGVRDSQGWTIEEIGLATDWPVAIALDPAGNPHTAFNRHEWIVHKWLEGGSWQADSFVTGYASAIDLEFGPDGSLHAAVHEDLLHYALWTPSGWEVVVVDEEPGFEVDMEVGEDGRVHIAYDEWSLRDLWYARKDSSGWYIEQVRWEGSSGWSPSMYLDALCNPHIFHSRNTSMEIVWWGVDSVQVAPDPVIPDDISLSILGNPVRGPAKISVMTGTAGIYILDLYSMDGRLQRVLFDGHLSPGVHELTLDPAVLPEGIYILRLSGMGTCCTEELVILR